MKAQIETGLGTPTASRSPRNDGLVRLIRALARIAAHLDKSIAGQDSPPMRSHDDERPQGDGNSESVSRHPASDDG
jgi:hypothetical protein